MAYTFNPFSGEFDFYEPAAAGTGGIIGGSVTGGTPDSVLFISAAGNLGQDNAQFYFQDSATTPTVLAANTNVALSVNTSGDQTGTNSINVYGQMDYYQVNSVINGGSGQAANLLLDGVIPGVSLSSSRGTGASPVNLNTGDFIGTVTGYGYTNSAYTAATAMVSAVRGTTSTNLGGELQFWTRTNAGTLTQAVTIGNTQLLGIGQTAPAALIHTGANLSASAWTTNGIALRIDPATYTDTTSSGTVAQNVGIVLGAATFAASSVTTYTVAVGVNIKTPLAGTNVTFGQTATALYVQGNTYIATGSSNAFIVGSALGGASQFQVATGTTGLMGVGPSAPAAKVHISGASTNTAWTNSGIGIRSDAATYTDSSTATGTIGTEVIHSLGQGTIAATNAGVVISNSATLYIPSAPTGGTNVTLTNAYALWAGSGGGNSRFDSVLFASSQLGVGTGSSIQDAMLFLVNGRTTSAALSAAGKGILVVATTYTDGVTTTGTLGVGVAHSFGTPTFAFGSGSATITNAATVYIANAPQAGTGATLTNSYALWMAGGILRADGGQVGGVHVVTAAGAVTVTNADYTIVVNKTVGAATTVNLPASPLTGTVFYIKDGKGDAATNNITITPAAGNIDGAGTLVINTNYGGYQLVYNGAAWNIV